MAEFEVDERVDITDVVCPMTFVKAKVAMEELEIGQVLAVTRNAIKLLGVIGYNKNIIDAAESQAGYFIRSGSWKVD